MGADYGALCLIFLPHPLSRVFFWLFFSHIHMSNNPPPQQIAVELANRERLLRSSRDERLRIAQQLLKQCNSAR